MVAPAHDDQVLGPAGHEELAVQEEPEIAGPRERARARVGQRGVERLARLLRAVPVAVRTVRPGEPDLPLPAIGKLAPRLRIDDADPLSRPGPPRGHQAAAVRGPVRDGLGPVLAFQRRDVEGTDDRSVQGRLARHEQGRFGKAVARVQGLVPEAGGRERLGEAFEGLGT